MSDTPTHKICCTCKETKTSESFYKNKTTVTGLGYECKECSKSRARKHYYDNWEANRKKENERRKKEPHAKRKEYRLMYFFNMESDQYYELLQKQNGLCAICGNSEVNKTDAGFTWSLSVDHDHTCCAGGKSTRACGRCNRGLLCRKCNTALGALNDDVELLQRAIEYLLKWRDLHAITKTNLVSETG